MKQYFIISEAMKEESAKDLVKFLNRTSYIPSDFNLLILDTLEEVKK